MDRTATSATVGPAERAGAHRRVGAAAILAFLVLLLLGALRGPAEAGSRTPANLPTGTSTVQPAQPAPVEPQPGDRERGFRADGDRPGPRGGGAPGGGAAPAPSTGGNQT